MFDLIYENWSKENKSLLTDEELHTTGWLSKLVKITEQFYFDYDI
jgi:hypothetical protein